MAIITLCSDWGTRDHYTAMVKGAILKLMPQAVIVDITHQIPPFNLIFAAFIIRNVYHQYPPSTIHIIDINSDTPKTTSYLIVEKDRQFFIAPDNGMFSLVFDTKPDRIITLAVDPALENSTFIASELFAPAACKLANGIACNELGKEKPDLDTRISFAPAVDHNIIRAKVIFIDSYENVFLNITSGLFEEVGRGRPFTIYFKTLDFAIQKISKSYKDVTEGEILAIFSSGGLLEIAMNRGNAASLLGLRADDSVRIEFRD
ncbi:MAG TPA: SAM-dependent chlorinase/fluorinase [Bacteroidales bacterium]|nr:SAM-dependent chlorinase/fluorinase [Bacteroidales bacterium]HSA43536.1 SAM-dependent chlorinase/fluorinase [Bacteroidales bacterium]